METEGLTYKQAHRKAELHEKFYLFEKDLGKLEKNLKMKHHEPVNIIEPTRKFETSKNKETKQANKKTDAKSEEKSNNLSGKGE
jgi:hypothetical protein